MDIKKPGGLPLPQPEVPLSTSKSGTASRLPNMPPVPPTTASQPTWQSGQLLQALVLKASPEQLLLNIQGVQASIARPPSLSLRPGDQLQLEVVKNTPALQLKLIDVQAATANIANRALRANLPQQQALPPLLANIEYLSRNPTATNQLNKAIRTAAQQIYYQLPTMQSLRQPAALKQAFELSGSFFESNLKASLQPGGLNVQQDTRTHLLRLSTQLHYYLASQTELSKISQQAMRDPARLTTESRAAIPQPSTSTISSTNPQSQATVAASLAQHSAPQGSTQGSASNSSFRATEQLLQQTEGALARLQIHQLHQLKSEEMLRPGWSIELPVRTEQGINLFDIRIHREDRSPVFRNDEDSQTGPQQTSQRWSVRMAFDLEGLGPVQAVIALQEDKVSVHFHAEQDQTNTLFNDYLDMLGSRLRHSGLEVAGIDCRQGQPDPIAEPIDAPILDEQV